MIKTFVKYIFILVLVLSSLEANYKLEYKGMTIGNIKTFETLEDGYLLATPANVVAKAFISFKSQIVLHLPNQKPKLDSSTKFKTDSNGFINVLNYVLKNETIDSVISYKVSDEKELKINCGSNVCSWNYFKNNELKDWGRLIVKKNKINLFTSDKKDIIIKKDMK